jgi:hypothetical protein
MLIELPGMEIRTMGHEKDEAAQLQRRNRELTILNEIAKVLNRSVDLDEALRATLASMVSFFELHTGWI